MSLRETFSLSNFTDALQATAKSLMITFKGCLLAPTILGEADYLPGIVAEHKQVRGEFVAKSNAKKAEKAKKTPTANNDNQAEAAKKRQAEAEQKRQKAARVREQQAREKQQAAAQKQRAEAAKPKANNTNTAPKPAPAAA